MPFVSNAQRQACWAQYNKDKQAGKVPKWNCKEWEFKTVHMFGTKALNVQTILAIKNNLHTFNPKDIQLLAKYQQIPDNINKSDQYWIIAINNFLAKK